MRRTERGFYTLIGWTTWKGAKWYVARRLGLRPSRRRRRTVVLLLLGTAAAGGATALVLSSSTPSGRT